MRLSQTVQAFLHDTGIDKQYCVAFSGGMDSLALLHTLSLLRHECEMKLRALHVDHGLHQDSKKWALQCESICREYNIPFSAHRIDIQKKPGESLEALAREARYDVFATLLEKNEVLLTAHHEEDQAETLLLQLFRGAGVAGLSAMPIMKVFSKGWHARPLLPVSKKEIETYVKHFSLTYCDDDANHNKQFSRNFIRHEVMPLLRTHYPSVTQAIVRSASHCQEAQLLLSEIGKDLLVSIQGSRTNTLSIQALSTLSIMQQKCVLRYWLEQHDVMLPSTRKIAELIRQMYEVGNDQQMSICWADVVIRKYRDDLYLLKDQNNAPDVLSAAITRKYQIRYREGGEKVWLRGHHHTLKKCFQAWGVPCWERAQLPLIFDGDILVCVPGYYLHEGYLEEALLMFPSIFRRPAA